MLNRSKPFQDVTGHLRGVRYEQDGKLFNGDGLEMKDDGEVIEFPEKPSPKKEPEPAVTEEAEAEKSDAESASLSFDKIKEETQPAPEEPDEGLLMVDRIKIVAPNDPNYVKKAEIISELSKLNIKHNRKDSRDNLALIFKEHLGVG